MSSLFGQFYSPASLLRRIINEHYSTSLVQHHFKAHCRDFPGVPVVKNLSAIAGDTGSILVREDPTCCRATKPVSCGY